MVPGKDTDDWKAIPFIYVVSDEDDMEMKSEPAEADSTNVSLVTAKREPDELVAKSEPLSQIPNEELCNNDVAPTFIKEESNEDAELILETISLEGDPAKEDEEEKKSDRENSLLLQIENLSKGLQDMKAQMRREKRAAATWSMALRVRKKVLKTKPVKKPLKSRFETPPKNEAVVSNLKAALEEQQTDFQWEQVEDNSHAESKVGKDELVTSEDHVLKSAEVTSCAVEETSVICGLTSTETPKEDTVDDEESPPFHGKDTIEANSEGMQVTDSEALQLLCSSKLPSQEKEQNESNYEEKTSGFGEGSKDPYDTDTPHEQLGGTLTSVTVEKGETAANSEAMSAHIKFTMEVNETTCEVKEGADANNEVSVEDNKETSKDKEEGLVNKVGGQLNSIKEIQHLQEGMKNMDVQESQGCNDEREDDDDGFNRQ